MALSSIKKSDKRNNYLDSLPEDLLVEISSCTAASSLSSVRNLRLVSKSFRHICDDRYVLYRVSLQELPISLWSHTPERFLNFHERCCKNGNPEALYRKGLINYFVNNRKHKGLKLLAEAAGKGNQEAKYVYGLILICLGGKTKQEGFKILSSVIKSLTSITMEELVGFRKKIRTKIGSVLWSNNPVMEQLKAAYVREKCDCDNKTIVVRSSDWRLLGEDNNMNIASACEFCMWHHEVKLFFKMI